jgi:signal transduction histidine kinase
MRRTMPGAAVGSGQTGAVRVLVVEDERVLARRLVTVANSGPVIDPERLPGLFEPFQRAGGRARSSEGGLDLGLAIVRSVANAHHAEVESVANPAGGLTVTIRLPDQGAPDPT